MKYVEFVCSKRKKKNFIIFFYLCSVLKNLFKQILKNYKKMKKIFNILLLTIISAMLYGQSQTDLDMVQAAYDGDFTLFKSKIDAGANIEAIDSEGYTALIYSCAYGYQDIAELLISKGANINSFKNDVNPMFAAVNNDNTDVIQILLDAGSDINCTDSEGYTPLMFAAQEGYTNSVSYLLSHGAKIDIENNAGHTATSIATQNNHNDVVDILILSNPKKAGYSKYANSPINTAEYVENKVAEKKLINYGMEKDYDAGIGYFSTGVGFQITPFDLLYSYEIGVHERAFKIDLYAGYATEKYSDVELFTKANIINAKEVYYLNLGKKFEIYEHSKKIEFGLFAGANSMYAFGKYQNNSEMNNQLLFGISAGAYLSTSLGVFRINYNPILNSQTDFFRHRISASLNVKLFKYTSPNTFSYADKTLYML